MDLEELLLGSELFNIMQEFDLWAPQTFFRPQKRRGDSRTSGHKRGTGTTTYVMEKRSKAKLERLNEDAQ
eukprot:SAG31_NODE_13880_length_840_cov_1.153846_2_plen_70_part_00